MQRYQDSIILSTGQAVIGASVQVLTYPAGAVATIYSDNSSTVMTNPLITDGNGHFAFYAADARYSLVITKVGIAPITVSDILLEDPADGSAALSASGGAALIGFLPSGIGAVAETLQSRGRWVTYVTDYMTDAQRAAIRAGTATDITAAIANAVLSLPADGGTIMLPPGPGVCITDPIVMPTTAAAAVHAIYFEGYGARTSVLQPSAANQPIFKGQTTVTPTYATAPNRIRKVGFKSHAAGSTGAAVDMKRMSYTTVEDIEFIDNGTGRFTQGILLDDESGAGHCYQNVIRTLRVNNQTYGPVTVVKVANTVTNYEINDLQIIGAMTCTGFSGDTTTKGGVIRRAIMQGANITGILPGDYTKLESCWLESVSVGLSDTGGRTGMHVYADNCTFNSAPFGGTAATTFKYSPNCLDSSGSIAAFSGDGFKFYATGGTGGGMSLDGTNRQMRAATLTIANNGTAQFTPWATNGSSIALIIDANNLYAAIYVTRGGANVTVEALDASNQYTVTAGNAGTTNIYWSAGNARYEIENKTGSSNSYSILFVVTS